MSWLESLSKIEDLEDATLDAALVAEFEQRADICLLYTSDAADDFAVV